MEHEPQRKQLARPVGWPIKGWPPRLRQAMITRGRNRDTAWFSVVDRGWPALRAAFEGWLDPGNFAADASQRRRLAEFRSDAG